MPVRRPLHQRALATALLATGLAPTANAVDVHIKEGWLRGERHAGVSRFLGIPYARPPVANLRWQPPRDPRPWPGVRLATRFGAPCAQTGNYFASNDPDTFDKPYGSEDCLYLNLWSPAAPDRPRPVLVFVHGGAFVSGAASLPLYDAQGLAEELDAVVVTINYRLGFFGHIASPALQNGDPASDSGNFGVLDQLKALAWVQRNIEAFGGDRNNVTLMGHSAGCISLWALLRSPLAAGLFAKAICLSGLPITGTDAIGKATETLIERLTASAATRPDPADPDALRDFLYAQPAEAIVNAARNITVPPPSADGFIVPDENADLANPVPAIVGSVANEASMLLYQRGGSRPRAALWSLINHNADDLERRDFFPRCYQSAKFRLLTALANWRLLPLVDESASSLTAQGVPVYRYEFRWNAQPRPWRDIFGSYHGLDLPFLFGNFERHAANFARFSWAGTDPAELETIHQQLVMAVRGFVERGDPNHYLDQPSWPRWDATKRKHLIQ